MLAAFQQPLIIWKPSGSLLLAKEDCLAGSIEGLLIKNNKYAYLHTHIYIRYTYNYLKFSLKLLIIYI